MKAGKMIAACLAVFWALAWQSAAASAEIAEKHTFAEEKEGFQQNYFYSYGRQWDFDARQNMLVTTVKAQAFLAGPGTYSAHVEIRINGKAVGSWEQPLTTTYTYYVFQKNIRFELNAGDKIAFFISGGTSSTPGGAVQDGDNYVLLTGEKLAPSKPQWYTCRVEAVGPMWERVYIKLSHEASTAAFDPRWYILGRGQEREMLAAGLMALKNGMKVRAYINPSDDPGYVAHLYLLANE